MKKEIKKRKCLLTTIYLNTMSLFDQNTECFSFQEIRICLCLHFILENQGNRAGKYIYSLKATS